MARHDVFIIELLGGGYALADPGTLPVATGDTIEFRNQTTNDALLLIAEDSVLDGVSAGVGVPISPTGSRSPIRAFRVVARDGTHEYQMLVRLSSGRQVYAVGSSTPRIIIRPTSEVS
jgi:hypothetical protein